MGKFLASSRKWISTAMLVTSSLVFLYTAGFGTFSAMNQRALLLALLGPIVYFRSGKDTKTKTWNLAWSTLLGTLLFAVNIYVMLVWKDRILKVDAVPFLDIVVGSLLIILVLEAVRRSTGWALTIICVVAIVYVLFGPYFPTILAHRGASWERLVNFLFMTTEGIYGIPLDVASTYIIVFVIFGAFLEAFGGGQWFVDVAYAVAGRFRGGPAKTAVLGSALMGMISGSPAANVATVGCFTIPLMKQSGYAPHIAAAIEAVASTGGMFTPPIMGAGAFIMAQYLGVDYLQIIIAAIMPSLLYYLALMLTVDAQAIKNRMTGLPRESLPVLRKVMSERGLLGLPIVFMIVAIVSGWSPMKTAFWATISTLVIASLKKTTRPKLPQIFKALEGGSNQVVSIVTACAAAGIIVGAFLITGLGAKLSYTLISLSNGNLYLASFFTMIIALVLGCAMPPTAVYVILASILVPALTKLGASPLSAHMFIFIFSSVGAITPPVAIAAYTAAAIAKTDPNKTGFYAFRFGLAAYIIPFMFIVSPALILQGPWSDVVWAVSTAILGILCIVIAFEGILFIKWHAVSRVLLGAASLLLLVPERITDLIGIAAFAAVGLGEFLFSRNRRRKA